MNEIIFTFELMSSSSLKAQIILSTLLTAICFVSRAQSLINVQATYSASAPLPLQDFWGINGTDVTDPGLGWDNTNFPSKITQLNASTLRYPGGNKANWWNWKTGGYVDGTTIKISNCYGLPNEFASIFSPNNNTLEKFKKSINTSGARPVFVLNLLSSSLSDQMAMLQEAQMQGFGLNEIEMGNEFYLDQCEYKTVFTSAVAYGNKASLWSQEIRKRFSGLSISFLAALADTGSLPRIKNWNTDLISSIQSSPADAKPDAFVLHQYKASGLGIKTSCTPVNYTDQIKPNCTAKKWQTLFYSACRALDNIEADEMTKLSQGYAIPFWFTEYNLFDHDYYVHGTWAHALHTSAMTLAFLDKPNIKHINCHTMFGNAIFSSLFSDANGFSYSKNSDYTYCIIAPPPKILTGAFTRTGVGYALSEIGAAMKQAQSAKKISFTGNTQKLYSCNSGGLIKESLQGWVFTDTSGNEQIIILNLSNDSIRISFPSGTNSINQPSSYETFAFDLNAYIYNTDTIGNIQHIDLDPQTLTYSAPSQSTVNAVLFNSMTDLAPFSITRFWYYNQSIISIVAQNNVVCEGNSVILQAVGDPSFSDYQWYHNDTLIPEATSAVISVVPIASTNNFYKVAIKNSAGASINSSPITIQVHEKPLVLISADSVLNICKGSSVTLKGVATNGNNSTFYYNWFPDKSITGGSPLNDSILITPESNSEYILYASDGICSGKSNPIKINILGNFELDSLESICSVVNNGNTTLTLPNLPLGITANYLWNNGSTTQNISLPSSTSPNYAVTVTYSNALNQVVCVAHRESEIYLAACCNLNYNLGTNKNARDLINYMHSICNTCTFDTINNKTIINSANLGTPRPPIALSGVFTVNEDLQLKNFVFQMTEGARIEIPAYRTLTLEASKFIACTNGKMWQGFRILKFGNLIVRSNSSIENARHAIETEDYTTLKVVSSTIKNNYIGVYYNGPGINTIATYNLAAFSNDTTPLKQKYGWMPETPGEKGVAGIWINNPAAQVGNSIMKVITNTASFTNLKNTIVINGSIGNRKDALNTILAKPIPYNPIPFNSSVSGFDEDH